MIKNIKYLFLLITFFCVGMVHAQTTDLIYHLGSSGSTLNVSSVATDASGNIFVCGDYTGANVEFNPLGTSSTLKSSAGTTSGFIAAYDANGILKKVISFGVSLNNKGLKVYVDPADKNVYLLAAAAGSVNFNGGGFTGIVSAGSGGMALVKYDKTLTVKTAKVFYNGTGNAGDILNDLAFYGPDLYVTGTLFTAAVPGPGVEFNPGGATKILSSVGVTDIFIAKYDTTTLMNIWAYRVGDVGADAGLGIDLDNSGNVYLTGYFTGQNIDLDPTAATKTASESGGGSSTGDAFVAKYNSLMVCQWAFNIGAAQLDRGNDILVDKISSTVYVGGITKKDALPVYFDPTTTATASFLGIGANDIFVASYTSAGAYNWHLATGSSGEEELTSLAFDTGGNIVLAGFASGNVNFGNSKNITGLGGKDAYFAVISSTSGLASAAYNLGGASDEQANGVTVGSTGKILVVGSYKGVGDYDLGTATPLPISGVQDGFITRHVLCTPPTITGSLSTCVTSTTQLTGSGTAAASNAWVSSTPSVGTVSGSGLVTGVAAGTSIITYTNSTGCTQTATVSVIPAPTISGTPSVCVGLTTQLTGSGTPATVGAWTSSIPSVATVNSSGLVTGVSAGTSIITYVNSIGCTKPQMVTVTAAPAITGTLTVCVASTTQLTGSGTAATSNPWVSASTGVATVNSTGLVTGVSAGTSLITYTNSAGCTQTATVTVNALPTITGTVSTCISSTIQLTGSGTAAASNAWVSATPAVATVNSTGLVTGVAVGTSVITYTNSVGCSKTTTVTIIAAPTITGTLTTCAGSTTQLTGSGTAAASNAWVSATPAVATVNSTGLVTGVAAGTSIITYTNSAGCTQTATVTLTTAPSITGGLTTCIGSTTQLTGSGTGAASNAWVSATSAVASISSTGLVSGVAAGTSIITYTNNAGCTQTATVTVTAAPTITGTLTACVGSTTQLTGSGTAAASNAWVSSTPTVATVNSTGLVTGVGAGVCIITYTNSNGCTQTAGVTITAAPTVTGTLSTCSTTQLTGSGTAAASNPWVSATPSVATVNSLGLVTGVSVGTSIITYTNNTGCTQNATVTITTAPTITGTLSTCSTTQLTGSGTAATSNPWVSASTGVATVNSTGLVTGISAGTSVITYTNSAGCSQTATVTINALPTITGTLTACISATTQLTGSGTAAASNPWASASTGVATVNSTGLVTGVSAGTSVITYTNSTGCSKTTTVTITADPIITGALSVCDNSTTQLTGSGTAAASNAWVSATPAVATVNSSGLVTGITAGTSIITYTNSSGCSETATLTVTALPAITGTLSTCSTTQLTGSGIAAASTPWVSASTGVATVNSTGLVTGVSAGTSVITYTNSAGCSQTATVTINALPTITGTASACVSATTQLTGSGTAAASNPWVSASTGVATVNSTGLVTGVSAGTSVITYTNSTGCSKTTTVTITADPTIAGTLSACISSTTQLTGSGTAAASNPWVSATPAVATVNSAGLVTGVSAGTSVITYTNSSGCTKTATVTVTSAPIITGALSVCIGSTSQLTGSGTAAASNAWVSGTPAVATVNSTGLVTAVAAGTSIITYTNNSGCSQTATVTVNAFPTITGTLSVCVSFTTQLTGSGTAAASNAWVSATPSVATVTNTGLVTGVAIGTSVITYTNSNGCTKTATVTVTSSVTPTVSVTSSATVICPGNSITLTANSANGGTPTYKWKLGSGYISGATNVSYTTTGALNNDSYSVEMTSTLNCASPSVVISTPVVITVNPTLVPAVTISTGSNTICLGDVITFTSIATNSGSTPSYVWRKNGVAITPSATGSSYSTTGAANGDVYSVVMTSNALCASPSSDISNTISVTVRQLPNISGTTIVCEGATITLNGSGTANASSPWVSSNPAIATVSNTGVVTGVSAGTSDITYTNSNGCSETVTVTVNPTPTVAGTLSICIGSITQLTGSGTAAVSNAWLSATPSVATVNSTGLVTGVAVGTSVITYKINTGCTKTVTVTVNALPTITGTSTVCEGATTQLTGSATADAASPWISASTGIATVSNAGLVTGVAGGTSLITYKNSNGCTVTQTVTVNPAATPAVSITANNSTICAGTSIKFTATPTDGGTTPTYKWKLGTGYISGETNSTYTTTTAVNGDSYSVEMTSNAICASASIANSNPIVISVSTSVIPTVTILANTGNTICTGTSVLFTATPGNGGTAPTYQWKKNGFDITTATNVTYTNSGLVNGDQISVDIVSNSTCASSFNASSTPITMVVNPAVSAIVTLAASSTTVCSGAGVIFTASYTNEGSAPLFEWFVNSISQGAPSSADTYTSSTLPTGAQVLVKMTSNAPCVTTAVVSSNSVTITVSPNVTPTVSITSDKTTICAGGAVIYTATPVNGGTASYQWKINGTNTGSATPSNMFTSSSLADGDNVTVVLTSSLACVTSTTVPSNGLAIIVAAQTQISSQPSNQSVCTLGNNVTFSVGAIGDNLTYQWKTGSTNLSNNSTYSGVLTKDLSISNVSNADLLGYKVTVTGTCGSLTSNVANLTQSTSSINITAQPIAQTLETGEMIQLSVSATGPTLSYQWKKNGVDLVNDSRISGANTASLQISNALVSDSDNNYTCLIMSPCAAQVSSNATSVTVTMATSTQDALTKGFVIAPNPSAGHFTLSNDYAPFIVEEIEIISMEGIVVARKAIAGTTSLNEEIFAQDLPKGMYLLVIKGEGEQALLKIIFDK